MDRARALDQLRADPSLAEAGLGALAKRWGVPRSMALSWIKAKPLPVAVPLALAQPQMPEWQAALTDISHRKDAETWDHAWDRTWDRTSDRKDADATPRESGLTNWTAYAAAVTLAAVAAYFSVSGMEEIFPGAPAAIMALACAMEVTKLVTAGWLARHWRSTSVLLRLVLIVLVTSLASINAAGVYGRLVEAHLTTVVATQSAIDERIGALDARLDAQARAVAGINQRINEIDAAIAKLTERGRAASALNAIGSQRKARDGLLAERQSEENALVGLRADRARLEGERKRADAANGPVVYMAAMLGMPVEIAIRWLILVMVLTCDPTAIALTVAASVRR
jgi:hypothetical protein